MASPSVAAVETTAYSWDFEGRMVGALTPTESLAFGYDADGMRTAKSVNGSLTRFLLDKNRDYAQVLEERDGAGAVNVAYVYGDDLISQHRPGSTSFFHYDGQLSTRQLTDGAASVTDSYTYDAFGVTLAQSGSTPNNYLYTGEQFDPNVGFYYLRARYLTHSTGRFMSLDSLLSGSPDEPLSLHRYLYAEADPIQKLDPSGQEVSLSGTLSSTFIIAFMFARALTAGVAAACVVTLGISFALSYYGALPPGPTYGPTEFCKGDPYGHVWIYRGLSGTNPGQFRVDPDGISFSETPLGDVKLNFMLRLRFQKPKSPYLTVGTVVNAPAIADAGGKAIFTPTPVDPGHWSLVFPGLSEKLIKELLSKLAKGQTP